MKEVLLLNPHKVADAREAMAALITSRSLSVREDDPTFPQVVAELAWKIADAMNEQRGRRAKVRGSDR